MEADFLRTLAETRELEQALSAAMKAAEGDQHGGPSTRRGFHAVQAGVQALQKSAAQLHTGLARERRRFCELHKGWRVRVHRPRCCCAAAMLKAYCARNVFSLRTACTSTYVVF